MASSDAAALVALVKALPDDAIVHARVWQRLHSIAYDAADDDLDAAAAAGAIEAVCGSLGRHASDAAVTSSACTVLQWLMQGHAANQARAGVAGAAPLLVATLATFPTEADVVKSAIHALDELTESAVNVPRVAAAGGRAALTRALRDHPGVQIIQECGAAALARLPQ